MFFTLGHEDSSLRVYVYAYTHARTHTHTVFLLGEAFLASILPTHPRLAAWPSLAVTFPVFLLTDSWWALSMFLLYKGLRSILKSGPDPKTRDAS